MEVGHLPNLPNTLSVSDVPTITIREVEKAINGIKFCKATGYDEISAEEISAATSGVGIEIIHHLCQRV